MGCHGASWGLTNGLNICCHTPVAMRSRSQSGALGYIYIYTPVFVGGAWCIHLKKSAGFVIL